MLSVRTWQHAYVCYACWFLQAVANPLSLTMSCAAVSPFGMDSQARLPLKWLSPWIGSRRFTPMCALSTWPWLRTRFSRSSSKRRRTGWAQTC